MPTIHQALPTQGTLFEFGPTATKKTVGDVVSWTGPRLDRADIDVTHLQSAAKEYIPGLADAGEFSMSVNFNLNDLGQKAIYDALDTVASQPLKVTFPAPGGSWTMDVIVKGFESAGAADDKITGDITLRVTGKPVWAAAA